ncbi:BTAD domain-containing putative transcriptional regulator [Haloactinopolyspora alba]|uniref:BTAD domain-containing putative transcriptional regulator n=1 Tax=Haloactinopolyspora alba TaxID=648780 RepID=UPI00101CD301|nr:BTAD domain-containing putative transcriptional regulator [Haloactinopolyspora alba]
MILVALVAGVPGMLWVIDGSPVSGGLPEPDAIRHAVTRPDDGTLFLNALILVGWFGWATFALSVLVEIPAAVRGVPAPRLPGLRAQQRFVAALITTAATAVPTAQMAAANTPATVVAVTAGTAATAATAGTEPVAAVAGAGERGPWKPAPPVTRDLLESPPDGARSYRVVAGDTLWDVAGAQLGDPTRYREIFHASTATVQPDGKRLTDPDVINPGWTLTIPGSSTDSADEPSRAQEDGRRQLRHPTSAAAPQPTTPAPPATPAPAAPARTPDVEYDDTSVGAVGGLPRHASDQAADALADCLGAGDTGVSEVEDDASLGGLLRTGGGVGAVLATGLIGVLTARRGVRQRRRRAGQRLAAAAAPDHAAEVELRHVADPSGMELVDRTLRGLAVELGRSGRPVPTLRAVRLAGETLELYLESATELPPPFVDLSAGRLWSVPAVSDVPGADPDDQPAPYPSLVTLGHDHEDGLLLVDLERLGVLHVDGPDPVASAVVAAVAAECATSPWADDLRVSLVGGADWAHLDALETGRVRRVDDVDRLLDELSVRAADDRRLLAEAGADGVGAARGRHVADATWTPEIILTDERLPTEQLRRLDALVADAPHVAVAAVTRGPAPTGRWQLRVSGDPEAPAGVLEPLGMLVRPQLLNRSTADHMVGLLRTADSGVVGTATAEPDLDRLPVLPEAGHRGFEPLLMDVTDDKSTEDGQAASAEPRQPESPGRQVPTLAMLGPVSVVHTAELGERNKRGQLTELAMFIAMNPGCDVDAIDEAIWPGSTVTRITRNTAISKLRRWLGTDAHGAPLLPRTEGRYAFLPEVRSDWQEWCDLLPDGPASASTSELRAALALVRGRPFSGRGRRPYAWADHQAQEMIAAIVDACHELAVRMMNAGEPREALRAALLGLTVEPGVELLWRDRLKAEVQLGDRSTVLASVEQLRVTADELGGDLEDDTERLVEQILRRQARTVRAASAGASRPAGEP